MKSRIYSFAKLKHGSSDYIFQIVTNRKLSDIYHSHDFYEFMVVVNGNCTKIINGEEVTTPKGSYIMLCPGDSHKFIKQSSDINIIALSVKKEEAEKFFSAFGLTEPLSFFNIQLTVSQLQFLTDFYNLKCESDYKFFLSKLIKLYNDSLEKENPLPAALDFAIKEMQKHNNLKRGIEGLAVLSGYSKTHLARLLKKHLNTTPHNLILNLRLNEAYNSLLLTNIHIEDLSAELGYESFSHFQKIFKKKYGITPAALRKKYSLQTI